MELIETRTDTLSTMKLRLLAVAFISVLSTCLASWSPNANAQASPAGTVSTNWNSTISGSTGTWRLDVTNPHVVSGSKHSGGFCFGFNLELNGASVFNSAILHNPRLDTYPLTVAFFTPANTNGQVNQIQDLAVADLQSSLEYQFNSSTVITSGNNFTTASPLCVSASDWTTTWKSISTPKMPVEAAIQIRYVIGASNLIYSRFVYFPISTSLFSFLPNQATSASAVKKANSLVSIPPTPDTSRPMYVATTAITSCEKDPTCLNYVRGPNVLGPNYATDPHQAWTEISHPTIVGTATPGATLTVTGGEWVGPSVPTYLFVWHHCSEGQGDDLTNGYAAGPYYYAGMTTLNWRPQIFCGDFAVGSEGTSFTIPANYPAGYVTVQEFVQLSPNQAGFGFYESAKGLPVTTNGVVGTPPGIQTSSVRICPISCTDPHLARPINGYSEGFAKTIDSSIGQIVSSTTGSNSTFLSPSLSWYLCTNSDTKSTSQVPADCLISPTSSNSRKYQVQQSDGGKNLRLCATATNSIGSSTQCSPTYFLTTPAFLVSKPTLSGTATVGSSLTISQGIWGGAPTPQILTAWYSCDYVPVNLDSAISLGLENGTPSFPSCGLPVGPRNVTSFAVTAQNQNKFIIVLITGTNTGNGEVAGASTYLISNKVP